MFSYFCSWYFSYNGTVQQLPNGNTVIDELHLLFYKSFKYKSITEAHISLIISITAGGILLNQELI